MSNADLNAPSMEWPPYVVRDVGSDLRCKINKMHLVYAAEDPRVPMEMADALTRMQACARWLAGEAVEVIEAGLVE